VKAGVEKVAPTITQTTVTLGGVHISVLTGSVGLKDLVVGNPEGYQTPQAISVGKAAVSVSPGSLLADKIVVRSIEIDSPEVTFEGSPFGENNLKKIMANVNSGASATDQSTNATTPSGKPAKSSGAAKKLEVDKLSITGIKVHASVHGKVFTLPIPDIQFTDLGTGPDGITAADLTRKILQEISTDTAKAVGENAEKYAGTAASSLLKGSTNGLGSVKKGLGGLFGK
jgi:uncharacterized protein involved in outer membrane biogenesis